MKRLLLPAMLALLFLPQAASAQNAQENPIYRWSLTEAWYWLINQPFLGFFLLLILGLSLLMFIWLLWGIFVAWFL
jgi:hypothetical protein